jgi:polyisoprenoid-binding protein YceI
MKKILFIAVLAIVSTQTFAQKAWNTRNAKISFVAQNDGGVAADNNEVNSRITDKGEVVFSLLMKGFKFELAEMQDHFNSEYIESNKYPGANFKGQIQNLKAANFKKDGVYKVVVKGNMSMHGATRPVVANGTIEVKGGKIKAESKFTLRLKDYNVKTGLGGAVTGDKIDVTVSAQYQ